MWNRELLVRVLQGEPVLSTLDSVGGTYDCPRGHDGEILGKLVGYAGTYDEKREKNWVGYYYADFAYAEQHPRLYVAWAGRIHDQLVPFKLDVVVGAPEGGKGVAFAIANSLGCRYIYPDTEPGPSGKNGRRSETKLSWGRHFLKPGERVGIGEDVTNSLSTAARLTEMVRERGAEVVVITSWLNRMGKKEYIDPVTGQPIPLVALQHAELAKFRQEDPVVAAAVAADNVVWKPKLHFTELRADYERHRSASASQSL